MNELMPDYYQGPPVMPTFDLDLGYTRPPLSANDRMHWARKAKITAAVRLSVGLLARRIPYLGWCEVTFTWTVTDARRRDADNLVPFLKAACDGLVDAGIVNDDTPDLMVKHMPIIVRGDTAGMVLRVAGLEPVAA